MRYGWEYHIKLKLTFTALLTNIAWQCILKYCTEHPVALESLQEHSREGEKTNPIWIHQDYQSAMANWPLI